MLWVRIRKVSQSTLTCYRYIHKLKLRHFAMEKPTAYFRLISGSQHFQVTFRFKDTSLKVEREFNFNRNVSEKIDDFLSRVKSNLEKVLSKKMKSKQKGNPNEQSTLDVSTELLNCNQPITGTEICNDVFFSGSYSELILRLQDIDYLVSVNCPWVCEIALPTNIMAGFPTYPSKLETLFTNRESSLFHWFRTKCETVSTITDKTIWNNVGTGFVYTPSVNDIGYLLKIQCTPSDGQSTGPTLIAVSSSTVQAGPGVCPSDSRHAFTASKLKENQFRIVSYNILADVYAETDAALNELFPYCARYALSLDYRKQLLCKEIIGYNSDIICLQEVDNKVFSKDLNPVLSPLGYSGFYSEKGGTVREGVACFYLDERFQCLDSRTIILSDELQKNDCLSDVWEHIKKKEPLKLRVVERHTALQVVVLKSKENPDELLVIGNTHLYFHPDADHVRLLQAAIIIKYLTNYVSVVTANNPGSHISLLICGDFNSVPECGIYKLMTTKHVPQDYIDWKSNKNEEVEGLELNQPWNLASACGTPKYTNFTVGFADCLDYIFYQTDRLAVKQVIPLPSEEELRQHVAIPSVVFPSDHIALIADLYWNTNT